MYIILYYIIIYIIPSRLLLSYNTPRKNDRSP